MIRGFGCYLNEKVTFLAHFPDLSKYLPHNLWVEMRTVLIRKDRANAHSNNFLSSPPRRPMANYSNNQIRDKENTQKF